MLIVFQGEESEQVVVDVAAPLPSFAYAIKPGERKHRLVTVSKYWKDNGAHIEYDTNKQASHNP